MKNLAFIIVSVLLFGGCNSKPSAAPQEQPMKTVLQIDTLDYWLGDVSKSQGSVSHDFIVYNKGNNNLVISKVGGGCHCMSAVFPKKPIAPGDSSVVTVTYDLSDPIGYVSRSTFIYSNSAPNPISLILRCNITE